MFICKVVKKQWLVIELFFILRKAVNPLTVMSILFNKYFFTVVIFSSFYDVNFFAEFKIRKFLGIDYKKRLISINREMG